ncbi:hypothetical protein BFN03_01245 [Rhodococcus sp. WMMA185]|nr:hypothetical protein BFN03_01245 [Rhodococcus sp. WMMA185]
MPVGALAVVGLTLGTAGVAGAGTNVPIQAAQPPIQAAAPPIQAMEPSSAMPISDDIDMATVIAGLSDPTGQWTTGPSEYISSTGNEIVPAYSVDSNGLVTPVNPFVVPAKHGYGGHGFGGNGHFKNHGYFKNDYGKHFKFNKHGFGGFFRGY